VVLAGQDGVKGRQEDLYRALHEHPELSGREVQTAATAAAVARDAGFEEVTLLAGS
jgi:hippurate hydrolase